MVQTVLPMRAFNSLLGSTSSFPILSRNLNKGLYTKEYNLASPEDQFELCFCKLRKKPGGLKLALPMWLKICKGGIMKIFGRFYFEKFGADKI